MIKLIYWTKLKTISGVNILFLLSILFLQELVLNLTLMQFLCPNTRVVTSKGCNKSGYDYYSVGLNYSSTLF